MRHPLVVSIADTVAQICRIATGLAFLDFRTSTRRLPAFSVLIRSLLPVSAVLTTQLLHNRCCEADNEYGGAEYCGARFPTWHGVVRIDVVMTAAGLVLFPVLAGIIGGVIAVLRPPAPAVVSGVQHFAAGVVMAAVAGEVLPQLRERGPLWLIVVGFAAGVAVLVGMRHLDGRESSQRVSALPVVFLVVVGVDLFIDGLLVGTGAAVSTETATIIAIALTVEVLFLGLSVALQLVSSGASKFVAAGITAGLSLVVAVGAILGALVLGDAGDAVLSLVLAFAAAALLWLVVEELLVEAHETPERSWMGAMFFVGFLLLFCLESLG